MELRLYGDYGGQRPNNFGCGRERSEAERIIVHSDQELPAFLELESAIRMAARNRMN
jgi:hypothetical protein